MNESRITVLMPVKYYDPKFVRKAVQSIITQTSPYWKLLIIVEDKDFEGLKKILQSELGDSRIEVIQSEGWQLPRKLNVGIRRAKTDFVGILLGDDMWSDSAVEVLNQYINQFPDVDFFHSSRVFIDENDQPISSVYHSIENFRLEDFVWTSPVKHLLCWRREKALLLGGMDESLCFVGPDDYDFPWSMAEAGAKFKAVRECLYLHRDHREYFRLTTHVPLSVQIREIKKIMRKHGVSRTNIAIRIASGSKLIYDNACIGPDLINGSKKSSDMTLEGVGENHTGKRF